MSTFTEEYPSLESNWRALILFGRNVASYKFALGKSLLEIASKEKMFVSLEELAVPFSRHITEHLKASDKQGSSKSSMFLQACRSFNAGEMSEDELVRKTIALGFVNVIDAFHVLNDGAITTKFYEDSRSHSNAGITVTDDLLRLKESAQFSNLPAEVEARWNLVETAWELNVSRSCLEISYDSATQILFTDRLKRRPITSSRSALNGYQKGKCFYCFDDISVNPLDLELADVDHFFPHILKASDPTTNFDGVWNLVLSCKNCNRGSKGKFAKVPDLRFLDRLHKRNTFLISSHHPLRETLILQSGSTEALRRSFLQQQYKTAVNSRIDNRWSPEFEYEPYF